MFRLQQCSARFGPSPFQCCVHYTQQELCSASLGRARRSSRSCVSPWRRWYNPRCFVPCCVADAIWSKTLVKGAPDAILSEVVSFSKLRLRKRSLWRVAQDAKLDFIGENLEEPNLHTRFSRSSAHISRSMYGSTTQKPSRRESIGVLHPASPDALCPRHLPTESMDN
jgi:hypothetical protein